MISNISIKYSDQLASLFLAHPDQHESAYKILFRSYLDHSEHAAAQNGVFQKNMLLYVWPHLEIGLDHQEGIFARPGKPRVAFGSDALRILYDGVNTNQDIFNKLEAIVLDVCAIAFTGQPLLGVVAPIDGSFIDPQRFEMSTEHLQKLLNEDQEHLEDLRWAIHQASVADTHYKSQWAQLKLQIGAPTATSRYASLIDHLLTVHQQVQTNPSMALGETFRLLNAIDMSTSFEEFVLENVCENIAKFGIKQGHVDELKKAQGEIVVDQQWIARVITDAVDHNEECAYTKSQKNFIVSVFSNYENATAPATLKNLNDEVRMWGRFQSSDPQKRYEAMMALALKLSYRNDIGLEQEWINSLSLAPIKEVDEFSAFKKAKLSSPVSAEVVEDATISVIELLCRLPYVFNQCVQKGLISAQELQMVDRKMLESWLDKSSTDKSSIFRSAPEAYRKVIEQSRQEAMKAIEQVFSGQSLSSENAPSNVVRLVPK